MPLLSEQDLRCFVEHDPPGRVPTQEDTNAEPNRAEPPTE